MYCIDYQNLNDVCLENMTRGHDRRRLGDKTQLRLQILGCPNKENIFHEHLWKNGKQPIEVEHIQENSPKDFLVIPGDNPALYYFCSTS